MADAALAADVPSPEDRANYVLNSGVNLSDWERGFLHDIGRRMHLSVKQEAKLGLLEARASGDAPDAKVAFLDAMEAAGVVPDEPISDRLGPDKIRFRCEGDRKGRRNGWARFYDDGLPAGSFGNYKLDIAITWHMDDGRELSAEERQRLARESQEKAAQRAAERDAKHREVAEQCRTIWNAAGPVNSGHGYLIAKGISGEGLRQSGNMLLVPMYDDRGQLWNLQRIMPGGRKLYMKDGLAERLHFLIDEPGEKIVIAEGYGTGAVIRRATRLPIAVAFTWCNLAHVAQLIRDRHPEADIIIAADDDAHLVNNPKINRNIGLEAARAAAEAVGGRLAVPPRKEAR